MKILIFMLKGSIALVENFGLWSYKCVGQKFCESGFHAGILRLRNRNIAKAIFRPKCCRIHEIDIAKSIFRSKINEKHDF